jgi:hypothetical protein
LRRCETVGERGNLFFQREEMLIFLPRLCNAPSPNPLSREAEARVRAVMLECGNVASIPRVEEGSEKYDEKKIFSRGPDNLIFGCC